MKRLKLTKINKKIKFKKSNRCHPEIMVPNESPVQTLFPVPIFPYDPQSPSFKLIFIFFNKYGVKII